ncbi:hypothetical protein ACOSQ4_002886 [Xanthoceras sorbifolium]
MGTIILLITLGQPPAQIKWLTEFLVVDTPSAYNIILGRPFLVRTKSVVSIYHHVLKFLVGDRVGVIHGDQHLTRKCYAASTNPTALLKHCMQVPIKDNELPQEKAMETNKRIPKMQERGTPVDDLEAVSIKDEDLMKMVRICAKLPDEEKRNGCFSRSSFRRRANIARSSPYTGSFRKNFAYRITCGIGFQNFFLYRKPFSIKNEFLCIRRKRL